MSNLLNDLLNELEARMASVDYMDATGLVVRSMDPSTGYTQVLGPFPKDTVQAFEVREQLEKEQTENGIVLVEVTIEFLFPPSHGYKL